ncbi:MAG TPA: rhombosortase [Steroidobacteraceae bacterium]|jgi:rhomboid family GlyGly-CTERM serine protease|nr:rhombosortase [Steroidobacteraceae bacterium]
MPAEGAKRFARIAEALQWDRGRWIWLLAIVLFLDLVLGLGDNIDAMLRYDRGAIAAGGWWRLLTAHIVHLNLHHLVLNELGLVLVWALFADDYDPLEWCVIVCMGALVISSGLWWLSPAVGWYVGASGLLHTIMAAGVARHLFAGEWDRWLLFVCVAGKLAYEQLGGHEPALVVVDAHLYGAASGFVIGAALSWRLAIIRLRLRTGRPGRGV